MEFFFPFFLASLEPLFSAGRGERKQHFSRKKDAPAADEQDAVCGSSSWNSASQHLEAGLQQCQRGCFCMQILFKLIMISGISYHCRQW